MPRFKRMLFLICQLLALYTESISRPSEFNDFIRRFPVAVLPDTIQYSNDEFENVTMEAEGGEATKPAGPTMTYQNDVLSKPDSMIIPVDMVTKYLLPDTENVIVLPDENTPDTIFPVYYYEKRLVVSPDFICLVFEKQMRISGLPYCQKWMCTFTNGGMLIDRLKVASAEYSGTGIMGDAFRVPYFPDEKSILKGQEINHFKEGLQLSVTTSTGKTELSPDDTYRFDPNGKILRAQ